MALYTIECACLACVPGDDCGNCPREVQDVVAEREVGDEELESVYALLQSELTLLSAQNPDTMSAGQRALLLRSMK